MLTILLIIVIINIGVIVTINDIVWLYYYLIFIIISNWYIYIFVPNKLIFLLSWFLCRQHCRFLVGANSDRSFLGLFLSLQMASQFQKPRFKNATWRTFQVLTSLGLPGVPDIWAKSLLPDVTILETRDLGWWVLLCLELGSETTLTHG